MARLGYINPEEHDGEVVTSIYVNSVEDGIREGQRIMTEHGWHVWVRDDEMRIQWEFRPAKPRGENVVWCCRCRHWVDA